MIALSVAAARVSFRTQSLADVAGRPAIGPAAASVAFPVFAPPMSWLLDRPRPPRQPTGATGRA